MRWTGWELLCLFCPTHLPGPGWTPFPSSSLPTSLPALPCLLQGEKRPPGNSCLARLETLGEHGEGSFPLKYLLD